MITRRVWVKPIRPDKLDGVADAIGTHTTNVVREAMLVAASDTARKARGSRGSGGIVDGESVGNGGVWRDGRHTEGEACPYLTAGDCGLYASHRRLREVALASPLVPDANAARQTGVWRTVPSP